MDRRRSVIRHFVIDNETFVDEEGLPYGYFYVGPHGDEYTELPWLAGERFSVTPPQPMHLHIDEENEDSGPGADFVDGPVPLVSERMRLALLDAGAGNIDFYPVQVHGADAWDECPTYHAINIVGKVAAANPSASSGVELVEGGGAMMFDRYAPLADALKSVVIARMAENVSEVIVSDRVRRACEKHGIDTLTFTRLDQWRVADAADEN